MEITIDDLNVVLGEKAILNNTTIAFAHGLLTGIIGPNGSGKSTLLKCIYRVFKPQSGAIFLDGAPLESYGVRQTAQKQAVLAQHNYNNFDFDVIDVVLMGRSPYKSAMESDNEEDYAIAMESLRTVGMEEYAEQSFSVLSGGEQQRVMLARALTQQTECLILDEPTNHLDIKYQLQLLSIVKNKGKTVIAALHDLNVAALYCDQLVAMKGGRIIKAGSPKEILTSDFIYQMYEVHADVLQREDGRLLIAYKNWGA